MRKIICIVCLIILPYLNYAQISVPQRIVVQSDSILNLLVKEIDGDKKADLVMAFYSTSIDGFPLTLINLSKKLFNAAIQQKDAYVESAAYSAAAQGYRLTGNHVRALEYHRKGVSLAEQTGNKILLGFALNQMAHIYKDRLENERAISLYREAYHQLEEGGRKAVWYIDMNLSQVYLNMANYDSSMYYARIALGKIKNVNREGNHSSIFSNIATIYSRQNKSDSVKKYFSLALERAYDVKSPRYLSGTFLAIAEYYSYIKQYDSSLLYYKRAIDIVTGTELNNLVLKPAKKLTDYYQNINADSTVKYFKVYSAANDSINSIRTNQQIQMLTFEEEQRKKDVEIAKKAYQNKIRTGLLLGGLAIFLLIAVVLYRNNRAKQKANAELENALSELKSAQSQLIQSEKMASLGELTAGIAHEIQNPLNFVNNFSEVSGELIDEMNVALEKGDLEDAKVIASDIQQNLSKIAHHGKRADSIVKGMLQHSRSSTGQKELTDINALCDEYLRLSYHGLRAKDNTFNAGFETQFDRSVGTISVVPQEIGRILLNLLNNAFYAVNEKAHKGIEGYAPKVVVRTEKLGGNINIVVEDNGMGIPERIKEKIFQPFFTTKPTGQGTGLGLSLSYDIVKAHGGQLQCESKDGQYTIFRIQLPLA